MAPPTLLSAVQFRSKNAIFSLKNVFFTAWTFRHISNASMEGFNTKIRLLTRQAYGFRDREYFKLKIYQLPEISCEKTI